VPSTPPAPSAANGDPIWLGAPSTQSSPTAAGASQPRSPPTRLTISRQRILDRAQRTAAKYAAPLRNDATCTSCGCTWSSGGTAPATGVSSRLSQEQLDRLPRLRQERILNPRNHQMTARHHQTTIIQDRMPRLPAGVKPRDPIAEGKAAWATPRGGDSIGSSEASNSRPSTNGSVNESPTKRVRR